MNNPIPPAKTILQQTIQPVELISATVNIMRVCESSELSTGNSVLSAIDSELSVTNSELSVINSELFSNEFELSESWLLSEGIYGDGIGESNLIVSELLSEAGGCLSNIDADKVVDSIVGVQVENGGDSSVGSSDRDVIIDVNGSGKISESVASNSTRVIAKRRPVNQNQSGLNQRTKFHRIAEKRIEQGVSLSRVAQRLGIDISEAREQEKETTDLKLSQLYDWRDILEVSVGELILEPEEIPSNPVKNRCQLVRMMKTVRSIIEVSRNSNILVLAKQLESYILELMPELETVTAWPSVGQARDPHSQGSAATRCSDFSKIYLRRNILEQNDNG
ncbi:MAG: helix-turn-helix domain-containing protein [Planctomycetaceae bacterium]|jgi:transcriptional regulator with XRE-family HTH domain|nr:helix-turn-helix domain-containing protein [Planctomycetaceae bacterium]